MQTPSTQKQELDRLTDQNLCSEFEQIIFNDFCSLSGVAATHLATSNEYFFVSQPFVLRSIEIVFQQKISFSKTVTESCAHYPAEIQIAGSTPQSKHRFSLSDLCAIFLPQNKFEMTKNWQETLHANLKTLCGDLENLYQREMAVTISGEDPKNPAADFWDQVELTPKHSFYAQAYPILKFIVAKAVPEITLAARWGSDSPYQRFLKSDHWALFSFRISKNQQVDIAQYSEMKKIKFRCALLDLGFLGNGYGKVARIKELISIDIPSDSSAEQISTTQNDLMNRVLKLLSDLIK